MRPIQPYPYLYPFEEDSLMKIAYYFDFDYQSDVDPKGHAAKVIAYAEGWRRQSERGLLRSVKGTNGSLVLHDTRPAATLREVVLSGWSRWPMRYL